MIIEIKRWDNGKVIHSIEADSLAKAVELLVAQSADLGYANLGYANLGYADLGYADLGYANLGYANLGYANLGYADLGYADLGSANLGSANLGYADLGYADLGYANLGYADLGYADLGYANLGYAKNLNTAKNLRLPTGETWIEYLTETVPSLLTAAGKSLKSFAPAWECHEWTNCPMAHAFDVHDLKDVPLLLRPRAQQFVEFFDAHQIPWPLPTKEQMESEATK